MSMLELIISLELGLIYGITAVGIYLTFRTIDYPDLTCDGSFVLGAAVSAVALQAGLPAVGTLVLAGIAGAIAGWTTWVLYTWFKISNLLSGILTAFMLYSINLRVMHGLPNIALLDMQTIFSSTNALFVLTISVAIILLALGWLLSTDFGLALRSLGQNRRLATNVGIRVPLMTLYALMLSNGLIALSGALFSQHQGFADVSQGLGTVIIGLAAVMIGEKLITSRSIWFSICACVMGSIMYRLLIAFALNCEWLGLQTQDLNLITGIFITAIMLAPRVRFGAKYA